MKRLVYISTSVEEFNAGSLASLAGEAAEKNARCGLTGLLCYRAGTFLQVLEGEDAAVDEVMTRVAADPRHCMVTVLLEHEISARMFADWSMGLVNLDAQQGIDQRELTVIASFVDAVPEIQSHAAVRALLNYFRETGVLSA